MPAILHDGLCLHFEVHGAGPRVVLLHGGVSSFDHNYAQFGWVEALAGYSVGAAVALELMRRLPARIERAVLVAAGDGLVGLSPHSFPLLLPQLAQVFERESYPADPPKPHSAYWKILESSGADRHAMRALCGGDYPPLSPDQAGAIDVPTLVISGERDLVLGRGARLAAALGRGEYLEIAGANHFMLAMDPAVRDAVAGFLRVERPA